MSTRAMYTFIDGDSPQGLHVYKHHDGYPFGACKAIKNALDHGWSLPRFEADDFAAAFVAGNKPSREQIMLDNPHIKKDDLKFHGGGGVRLMPSGEWQDVAPGDIEYRYVITCDVNRQLLISGFKVRNTLTPSDDWTDKRIFHGTLAEMEELPDD